MKFIKLESELSAFVFNYRKEKLKKNYVHYMRNKKVYVFASNVV